MFSNADLSGSGSRLGGQLLLMAPSDGVRRKPRQQLGADGMCVGVRDWRGLRLKLSRWVLTSGLKGVWEACCCETGGGEAEWHTSSSSLSERSSERVELQSDTEDKDSNV